MNSIRNMAFRLKTEQSYQRIFRVAKRVEEIGIQNDIEHTLHITNEKIFESNRNCNQTTLRFLKILTQISIERSLSKVIFGRKYYRFFKIYSVRELK